MSFMEPQIVERADILEVLPDLAEDENGEGLNEHQLQSPYWWRLSAPGYMDCTEWTPADSIPEAVADMLGMYGDSFDWSDLQAIGGYLDGFAEFWNGYLLGLAFTGNKEGSPDAPYEEPIYSNPGGSIADVVDTSELESAIPDDVRIGLYSDCLSFFVDALPFLGESPDFESAGSDFHLTRNGHGAGFWDGDWEQGDKLTELSRPYGTCELVQYADGSFDVRN